uniref:SH3 domain-binding glutamic acid-rich-like protein 3 isoform X1 n=2 Tax=Semicossyphus pulcher TaxID=241346 RepID=UPI0037E8F659
MPVKVFYASVSGCRQMKKKQDRIFSILNSKSIPYEVVDIAQCVASKDLMREMAGNPTALPPQICNGDTYCGDFDSFEAAIEAEQLEEFLKI